MGHTTRDTRTAEYIAWQHMRQRCTNANSVHYPDYGGRGIIVCARWASFKAFYSDMGKRPSASHVLDRIDNDGNYEPSNCRWATRSQSQANRRTSVRMEYQGRTMTITEWARELQTNIPAVYRFARAHDIPILRNTKGG